MFSTLLYVLILSCCPRCAFGKEILPFAGTSKLPQIRFLSLDDDDDDDDKGCCTIFAQFLRQLQRSVFSVFYVLFFVL